MYETFYKLSGKPFQLNPDPRFFFKSKGHLRAMAYLRFGLQQEQGFIIVTGDVGTGKTMLVNNLFRELEAHNIVAAKIVSTNVKEHDLLRMLAADFHLPYDRVTKAALLLSLRQFFESCVEDGKRVLLIIDECQNLPRGSLEELRMLSNFDFRGKPLVQSFLLGQREFKAILRSQGLEQLRQRVTAAYHLRPLSAEEVNQYVLHRLHQVGWRDDPSFEDGVFKEVYRFTRGVPRRINTLMDRLLLHASLEQYHRITLEETRIVTTEIEAEQGGYTDTSYDGAEEPIEQDGSGQPPPVESQSASTPPAGEAELKQLEEKLEQRISQMQQTVDRISISLQSPPPAVRSELPPPEEPGKVSTFPVWTLSFGLAVIFVILVAGSAVYYLLHRAAG